ncbi:hypothetical protein Drose_04450 [Dactylosporangium roseum]|uniref:Uncharacterized protein n=1 Tax=Dactylosporangium roseum TaxID=47989 RepID=A0ABY5Z653_9ACTN|nr:hypothetical protein [Dactylosporangium roseum]UWZ37540.1 hypothetical protein Drose_04450 [Dactylosporangium roseum]
MPADLIPEPPERTIVAWWDHDGDLRAVAYRTDAYVEAGDEERRWYITDDDGSTDGDWMTWPELLAEMRGWRGPSELVSNGRLEVNRVG